MESNRRFDIKFDRPISNSDVYLERRQRSYRSDTPIQLHRHHAVFRRTCPTGFCHALLRGFTMKSEKELREEAEAQEARFEESMRRAADKENRQWESANKERR